MRLLLFSIAIAFNINVIQAEKMFYFEFSGEVKSRPTGQPSVVWRNMEFFGKRPTQDLEVSAGNCCANRPTAKLNDIYCPSGKLCCRSCKVYSYDSESKKNNRVHFVSSINTEFAQSRPPPGTHKIRLQMISQGQEHHWKKIDYYGLLSSADKVLQMGSCCIRELEAQVKTCGAGGYCCASCSVDSMKTGVEINGID
jgi:hypothetical protein